jgi:DNA repair protein RadA/Sms
VRAVPRIENRIKEAIHMGFEELLLPKRNLKGISKQLAQKIRLRGIEFVDEALNVKIS